MRNPRSIWLDAQDIKALNLALAPTPPDSNIAPPLAQGADFIQGSGLKLLINIPQSTNIDSSINTYLITTDTGAVVGFGYNICIEDSYDKDFNDVCINLVAWKNRG